MEKCLDHISLSFISPFLLFLFPVIAIIITPGGKVHVEGFPVKKINNFLCNFFVVFPDYHGFHFDIVVCNSLDDQLQEWTTLIKR